MPQILSPYGTLQPYSPGDPIPFGAALLVTDSVRVARSVDLAEVGRAHPWLPIAVQAPAQGEGAALLAHWRRDPALRELSHLPNGSTPPAAELRKAIAKRGAPTADELVGYIHERCGSDTFARALRAELLRLPRPGRSARHEVFRGRGRLTATGWRRLFLLTQAAVLEGRYSAEGLSNQLLVDGRTIRAATKTIGLDWYRINDGFGWKWVVEVVLRRHGYVRVEGERLLLLA